MNSITDSQKCTGCAACANICPRQCITMLPDAEGFLHPQIDCEKCVDCRKCISVCPIQSKEIAGLFCEQKAFAGHSIDSSIVEHSSSGGVFSVLAEYVIQRGGVVFGASFDGPELVRHVAVRDKESLEKLRGSKYVQSIIGCSYQEAKYELDQGKLVLFSGTPCQIAGLRHFLQREYDNLLCVDIICHSIPSPKVWKAFVEKTAAYADSKITSANFRDKRDSWESYCLSFQFEDGNERILNKEQNLYMHAFIGGLSTRPSCYQCAFKGDQRESDLTLGDFWGVNYVQKEAYHSRGTSLVIVNTKKGEEALNQISSQLELIPTLMNTALLSNPAYYKPAVPHPRRARFFSEMNNEDIFSCIETLLQPTKKEKFTRIIKRSLPYRAVSKLLRLIHNI